jgi:ASC-1-like (ASCH) protein
LKTVEARLNVAVPASIDVGHVLKLGHLRCLVKERRVYEAKACNVRAMLEDVGVEPLLPGCGSVEDGVRTYHAIDGFEEGARSHGVVSFFLEVLPPRSACPSAEEAALAEKLCALVRELDGACEDLPEALRELARELMLEREQEQDEWVACIADDDSQADGHKQFARVTEQLRRASQRFTQNRAHEQTVPGHPSRIGF